MQSGHQLSQLSLAKLACFAELYTRLPLIACLRCAQTAESGRGKPVLNSVLACSLCFHAITLERSKSPNQTGIALNLLVYRSFFASLRVVVENLVRDRQAYGPSTVTLAAHARRNMQTLGELRMRGTAIACSCSAAKCTSRRV